MAYGVLFVCTGNICRSPTAEGVLRHAVRRAGLTDRFVTESAGTHGYHIGAPPDRRAVAAAGARGVDIGDLRARLFTGRDFDGFDLILGMDTGHLAHMKRMARPGARARLARFMEFCPDAGVADVPDPYYGGTREFEYALDLIERGVDALLAQLMDGRE